MNFALTNIIPLNHSSMNWFMLQKYITEGKSVKGGLGNNVTHCHKVNTPKINIWGVLFTPSCKVFSSVLSSFSSQRIFIKFCILATNISHSPRSLPSVSFLTVPTYLKKFIVHHSNLSQRGKGKFTEEIIREKEKKRN